jgi:hypothetical protein
MAFNSRNRVVLPENFRMRTESPLRTEGVCQGNGSREWDRTTDHLHVKEVLYH